MIQPILRTQQMTRAEGNSCPRAGNLVHQARLVSNTTVFAVDRFVIVAEQAFQHGAALRVVDEHRGFVAPAHGGFQRHVPSSPTGLVMPA